MAAHNCVLCSDLAPRGGRLEIGGGLALMADAAPLLPNHLLLHSVDHTPSFATLSQERLDHSERILKNVCALMESDAKMLFFEHGVSDGRVESGCVDHAHIHILPHYDHRTWNTECLSDRITSTGLAIVDRLFRFSEIEQFTDEEYFWVGVDLTSLVRFSPLINERQTLRRIIAQMFKIENYKTWDIYDLDSAKLTTTKFRARLLRHREKFR